MRMESSLHVLVTSFGARGYAGVQKRKFVSLHCCCNDYMNKIQPVNQSADVLALAQLAVPLFIVLMCLYINH